MKLQIVLLVFTLASCTSNVKKESSQKKSVLVSKGAPKAHPCSERILKSRLTQILGKIPGEELVAYAGCKSSSFSDSYGRKHQTDQSGNVVIPEKIREENLLPPSVDTFPMDASLASRLFNMQYFEVSFKMFISLLDLNPHGESNQVFRSWFCRNWKKLKEKGANWARVTAMVPIGIHKTGKTWKYINHFHNFSLNFDFTPIEKTKVLVKNNSTACLSAIKSHGGTKEFILLSLRGTEIEFDSIFKNCDKTKENCKTKDFTINYTSRKLPGGLNLYLITSKNDIETLKNYLSVISLVSSSAPCNEQNK